MKIGHENENWIPTKRTNKQASTINFIICEKGQFNKGIVSEISIKKRTNKQSVNN